MNGHLVKATAPGKTGEAKSMIPLQDFIAKIFRNMRGKVRNLSGVCGQHFGSQGGLSGSRGEAALCGSQPAPTDPLQETAKPISQAGSSGEAYLRRAKCCTAV